MTVALAKASSSSSVAALDTLASLYRGVRRQTEALAEPLEIDDYGLQSMPEASPVKWHLAHTTWFFETFVLQRNLPSYRPFDPAFSVIFNSYYQAIGPQWPRHERGLIARPTVAEVFRFRAYVDEQVALLLTARHGGEPEELKDTLLLGLSHEQQHQELIITDLKHAWFLSPTPVVYRAPRTEAGHAPPLRWLSFPQELAWIGHNGGSFAFDNEGPRHRVFSSEFQLASRPATSAEYLAFMTEGGYDRPELWLSDGWAARQKHGWNSPLYWQEQGEEWSVNTLGGSRPVRAEEPVCHVSFYEADAFARWAGARLPTEAEWERAAGAAAPTGHFVEGEYFHPAIGAAPDDDGPVYKLFGDVWQWTSSPYVAYPGYQPAPGALGEYNGKFMCNQIVLRGASCATPRSHARSTYRNFFPPETRWQFSGIRLAKDPP